MVRGDTGELDLKKIKLSNYATTDKIKLDTILAFFHVRKPTFLRGLAVLGISIFRIKNLNLFGVHSSHDQSSASHSTGTS